MITYCIEKLYHFRCNSCDKWWTIGDFEMKKQQILTCPHCGKVDEVREDRRRPNVGRQIKACDNT